MSKYSRTAILLHWTIAILVVTNVVLASMAKDLPSVAKAVYMAPHKAIGVSILLLSLYRLFWRLGHRPPPLPSEIPNWQAMLGRTTHALFYFLIIAVPISGWMMSSAHPMAPPVSFFGLVDITLPIGKSESLAGAGKSAHVILTKPLVLLVFLHVLAALKHQFADRLPFIQRMWP